jgi:hypothetical protein
MHLSPDERILKVFYHHPTPFIFNLLKLIFATLPFYFILFAMKDSFAFGAIITMHIIVVLIFSMAAVYITLIYWLDRLIVTNKRIVFIDWKYLTVKTEHEATLNDIQDITSTEKGLIALIPLFDYGRIVVKTASAKTLIDFPQAPDPDGIKKFIQNLTVHDNQSSLRREG